MALTRAKLWGADIVDRMAVFTVDQNVHCKSNPPVFCARDVKAGIPQGRKQLREKGGWKKTGGCGM